MKKTFDKLSTIVLVLILLVGLSLLLYPTVANWYNQSLYNTEIKGYTTVINNTERDRIEQIFEEAEKYNEQIRESGNSFSITDDERLALYHSLLNVTNSDSNSMMGYLSIPKINVSLPIYHGTDDAVLNSGIGHIEGTGLPIGGIGVHSVLSGHRGLPSSRLLTDLDRIVVGDNFYIEILGKTIYYEVDQILTVLPENVDPLKVYEDEDFCTLVTCTPYGVNSHRLLVRGKRIDTPASSVIVSADAYSINRNLVALCIAIPIIVVVWLYVLIKPNKRKS